MSRQDIKRQRNLEPKRIEYAKNEIEKLGYEITFECDTRIEFMYKGEKIEFYPYSGWASGKGIENGRGIEKLLTQIQ